jgi:magnesium transporter
VDKEQIMTSKNYKKKIKLGLAPGSLVFTGEQKMKDVKISIIQYWKDSYKEIFPKNITEAIKISNEYQGNTWINIDGIHDEKIIEELCTPFGIHKLTMEDILSVNQRPKLEEHADYLHIVAKMLNMNINEEKIEHEQISFILKGNMLITFQEKEGDVLEGVRKRMKEGKGLIRSRKSDYMLYAVLDTIIDYYFLVLEILGDRLTEAETYLLTKSDNTILNKIHSFRSELLKLRKAIYPLREVVSRLEKLENPIINKDTNVFIRDLYDHTIQVIDNTEILREINSGLLDLYMNSISNKMNEIMKVLTIIATIFIPLTFIAGIYGMNFEVMPELQLKYGYYLIWGIMLIIFGAMITFFKKKKWI